MKSYKQFCETAYFIPLIAPAAADLSGKPIMQHAHDEYTKRKAIRKLIKSSKKARIKQ